MKADDMAGERIYDERRSRGWTHEDMAREIYRKLGAHYATSARTIWRVEAGHRPSVRKQYAIATVLGLRAPDLWVGRSAPARTPVAA